MKLVDYSSSSSDEDIGNQKAEGCIELSAAQRRVHLLPKAVDKLGTNVNITDEHLDDSNKHEGRIRSFKHERGNWAAHVYIPVESQEGIETTQELYQNAFRDLIHLHRTTELHITLSRTVVLQHHLIESFCKSLQLALNGCFSFTAYVHDLKIYTNEERTRTFIGLEVNGTQFEKFHTLMKAVDDVMLEHKLAQFYEDASFHISILWCVGDMLQVLDSKLMERNASIPHIFPTLTDEKD